MAPVARAALPGEVPPLLAADETTLWLLRIDGDQTLVYSRDVSSPFMARAPLNAPIVKAVSVDGTLFAFVESGGFYSLLKQEWTSELNLPERVVPLDVASGDGTVFALIPSPPSGVLPRVGTVQAAETQPFDPGDAPLTIARYDHRQWEAFASCPERVRVTKQSRRGPRLGVFRDAVWLFWVSVDDKRVEYARFDAASETWTQGTAATVSNIDGLWLTLASRVLTLVVATPGGDLAESLGAFRMLESDRGDRWRAGDLRLSELPAGAAAGTCQAAFGFNQHIALLVTDTDSRSRVRFGRVEALPAETTIPVTEVFDAHARPAVGVDGFQTLTMLILFSMLLALFLFRRGAMIQPILLPHDCAPALAFQRMMGCVIDLALFVPLAALVTEMSLMEGLRGLLNSAIGNDAAAGRMPSMTLLLWWGLGTGGCTAYSLVMELMTQRTLGKMLTRTRVFSETGGPPTVGQIVVRNLLRFIELQPPFWVMGLLVLVSRKRQRVGDIFARTIVVRRVRLDGPPPQSREE